MSGHSIGWDDMKDASLFRGGDPKNSCGDLCKNIDAMAFLQRSNACHASQSVSTPLCEWIE